MFLGENLPSWLILAIGAALAVGNLLALLRPRPPEGHNVSDTGADGSDQFLERPPLMRSLFMIAIGTAAALWALASLVS